MGEWNFTALSIRCAMHEKGSNTVCRHCRPRSAQANQGLHYPLRESVDTVVFVNKQKMSRLDCTDAHADLDLRCPHKGPFGKLSIMQEHY